MTPKQKELLDFIKGYVVSYGGVSPTYGEMMIALNLHSKSGVGRLVDALVAQQLVRRSRHRARSVQPIEPVDRGFVDRETLALLCRYTSGEPLLLITDVVAEAVREYVERHPRETGR